MTGSTPANRITFHLVVDGLDPQAQQLALAQFQTRQGGARPGDLSLFISAVTTPVEIDAQLAWLNEALPGRFKSTTILVTVGAVLSWAEYSVPRELALAASTHGSEIKVLFASKAGISPSS